MRRPREGPQGYNCTSLVVGDGLGEIIEAGSRGPATVASAPDNICAAARNR